MSKDGAIQDLRCFKVPGEPPWSPWNQSDHFLVNQFGKRERWAVSTSDEDYTCCPWTDGGPQAPSSPGQVTASLGSQLLQNS